MTDNKLSKLRVSRAEASEKIRSQIEKGKELLKTEILSENVFTQILSEDVFEELKTENKEMD